MTKIVELKNATVQVNNGFDDYKTILDDVSLDIYERDFLTILGGNGAGKSTLFNVLAGTLTAAFLLWEKMSPPILLKSEQNIYRVSFRILKWGLHQE